jgi:serine/threonine protein kinase
LKPENILLVGQDASSLDVKLIDFGVSCCLDPDDGLDTIVGSPFYYSPEQCRGETYNHKVDIWALGLICYQIINADIPFPIHDDRELQLDEILNWNA